MLGVFSAALVLPRSMAALWPFFMSMKLRKNAPPRQTTST